MTHQELLRALAALDKEYSDKERAVRCEKRKRRAEIQEQCPGHIWGYDRFSFFGIRALGEETTTEACVVCGTRGPTVTREVEREPT